MFITFEGIEGCGKTTQIAHAAQWIRERGLHVLLTREPGATVLGKKIRSLLLDPERGDILPETEWLLYAADRVQHLAQRVEPALDRRQVVLCDRYIDATLAYQGFARKMNIQRIRLLHEWVCKGLMPQKTFLLDLPVEKGLERAWRQINGGERTANETRFEKESLEFHQKVRDGYLKLAADAPERFILVNADRSEEQVRMDIRHHLQALFPAA